MTAKEIKQISDDNSKGKKKEWNILDTIQYRRLKKSIANRAKRGKYSMCLIIPPRVMVKRSLVENGFAVKKDYNSNDLYVISWY